MFKFEFELRFLFDDFTVENEQNKIKFSVSPSTGNRVKCGNGGGLVGGSKDSRDLVGIVYILNLSLLQCLQLV